MLANSNEFSSKMFGKLINLEGGERLTKQLFGSSITIALENQDPSGA